MASSAIAHHLEDGPKSFGECEHGEAVNYEALEQ